MKRIVSHTMKLLVLGLAVLALGACSTTPTRLYTGPMLPAGETAVVKAGPFTDIVSINGVRVSGNSVTLLPGRHTVEMRPSDQYADNSGYYGPGNYIFYSRVNGRTDFVAEPGHIYQVYADMKAGPSRGYGMESDTGYREYSGSGFIWTGYVEDKTTGRRVAKTDRLPLEAYPRGTTGGWGPFVR